MRTLLVLAVAALPLSVAAQEAPAGLPIPPPAGFPVDAPAPEAEATATATAEQAPLGPRRTDAVQVLNPQLLGDLNDASLAHSWAGPFRVLAIQNALTGGVLIGVGAGEDKPSGLITGGLIVLGVAAVDLTIALILDASARDDVAWAGARPALSIPPSDHEAERDDARRDGDDEANARPCL